MANTLANSLAGIQPVPPLVARGGALRTFGGLALLLAVILSVLGVYLIEDQFTNPLASQPLGLFAAAFLLATAMALVYELVQLPTSIWWTGNETALVPRTSTRPVRIPGQRPPGATKSSHLVSPIPPSPVSIPIQHASNLAKAPAPTVRPSSTPPVPVADPRPPSLAKPPSSTSTPAPLVRVTDQLPLSLAQLLTPVAPPTPIPSVRVAHQPRPDTAKIPIVPAMPSPRSSPRPRPLVRVATLFPDAKKPSAPVTARNPAPPTPIPGLRSPAAPKLLDPVVASENRLKKPPATSPRGDQRRDLPYQHCYVDRVRVRA